MHGALLSQKYLLVFGGVLGVFLLGTALLVVAGLRDDLRRADVALVLGNSVQLDGTPSPRLRARLDRTFELYRSGYFPAVIVSGGRGREGYDEAVVMRDYLVSRGIPASRIIVDGGGVTTLASARNAARIARQRRMRSVFVVSQYFHLPRARLALRRCGFETIHSAHARFFELRDLYSSPRELVAYVSYLFRAAPSAASARLLTRKHEPPALLPRRLEPCHPRCCVSVRIDSSSSVTKEPSPRTSTCDGRVWSPSLASNRSRSSIPVVSALANAARSSG